MVGVPFRRSKHSADGASAPSNADARISSQTDRTLTPNDTLANDAPTPELTKWQLHRATRTRKTFALVTSFFLLITVVFLILVEIGDTAIEPVLTSIWFIRLDLSSIVPASVPDAVLLNTIAQTLGLHDFYTVGLWNFCEGYLYDGVTHCSDPQALYWFNPVEILLNELLAGATSTSKRAAGIDVPS